MIQRDYWRVLRIIVKMKAPWAFEAILLLDLLVYSLLRITNGFETSFETCSRDSDCRSANKVCNKHFTDCMTGTCMCRPGYVLNLQQGRIQCARNIPLGGRCSGDTDTCPKNADCLQGTCKCRHDYVASNRGCHRYNTRRLGEYCRDTDECEVAVHGSFGSCERGRCSCHSWFKQDGDTCRAFHYQEQCPPHADCGHTMTCIQGRCQCPKGTTFTAQSARGEVSGSCQPILPVRYLDRHQRCDPGSLSELCASHLQCGRCPEWRPDEYQCIVLTAQNNVLTSEGSKKDSGFHLTVTIAFAMLIVGIF